MNDDTEGDYDNMECDEDGMPLAFKSDDSMRNFLLDMHNSRNSKIEIMCRIIREGRAKESTDAEGQWFNRAMGASDDD